jgi:prepilin-type N-terminal cleavage/methylation domain-containing protein/prepilin-type processing-associated H-X9-DG protein
MKNSQNPNPRRTTGFTLVEILITITIMAALAALATIGTRRLREGAETATTLRRITGFFQANALYAADHSGSYVPIYSFNQESQPSMPPWHFNPTFLEALIGENSPTAQSDVWEGYDGLPEQVLDPTVVRAKKKYWSRVSGSFGYNEENVPGRGWGLPGAVCAHTTTSVKNPSRSFAFITATDWLAKYNGRYLWKKSQEEGKSDNSRIAYRHQGKAVAAFYDGHAETVSIKDMKRIDKCGGINNVFWGGSRVSGQ